MTTKVTVDAHAGWPVKVEAIDTIYDENGPTGAAQTVELGIVEPGTVRDFYCTNSRQLVVTEMKRQG
jgi:hypothetical protein